MKKILFYLVAFFAFFTLVSCDDNDKGPKLTGYDFHETIVNDSILVAESVINNSGKIKFCEAQGMFKENFTKNQETYEVVFVRTVFQVDSLVYIITHPEEEYDSEPIVEAYNDIWIGDLYSPISVNVDLKQAIKNINESDIEAPETPFFVLRRPIIKPPFPEYMYYIFGSSKKGAITIDSHTGEVAEM